MTMAVIGIIVTLVGCVVAARANARLRDEARIPMQWSLSGRVTWYAPRLIALTFLPALTAGVLGTFCLLSVAVRPRPGQQGAEIPIFVGIGVMLIAIQLLHLWLAERTLRGEDR